MKVTDDGKKMVKKPVVKSEYIVSAYITAAIKKNKNAFATFEAFALSHRKEYATCIDEANTEETKNKRIAQAIELMAEGKSRN